MAIFNPQVPDTKDPNFFYSKPIGPVEFKSSAGIALKDAGEIASSAIKGGDEIVKSFASQSVKNAVYPEREQFIEGLDAGYAYTVLKPLAQGNAAAAPAPGPSADGSIGGGDNASYAPGKPMDLLGGGPEVPEDLKNLPMQLDTLRSAKDARRIPEMYYVGKLMDIAKDVRSRYPEGYREYIDHEISKITGFDPANKYIGVVMASLVAAQQPDKEVEHILADLRHAGTREGITNADKIYALVKNRQMSPEAAMSWLTPRMQFKWEQTQREADIKRWNDNKGIAREANTDYVRAQVGHVALDYFTTLQAVMPDGVEKDQYGHVVLSSDQARMWARQIDDKEKEARAYLDKWYMTKNPNTSYSPSDLMTKEDFDKHVNPYMSLFGYAKDRMLNEKTGDVFLAANLAKDIEANDKLALYRNKDIGWIVRQQKAIRETAGQEAADVFFAEGLKKQFSERIQNYITTQKMDMIASDPLNPKTLKQAFDEAQRDGITFPKALHELTTIIDDPDGISLLSPKTKDEAKLKIANGLFSPKNRGLLVGINPDSYDDQGRFHPGKESLYRRLGSADIATEVKRLSNKNPDLWRNYVDTMEHMFGSELLSKEIQNLNSYQQNPNLAISWDDENNQWGLVIKDGDRIIDSHAELNNDVYLKGATSGRKPGPADSGASTLGTSYLITPGNVDAIRGSINRLNSGLRTLSNAAAADPKVDVEKYLLDTMATFGADYGLSLPEGLPGSMVDAILAAKKKEETISKKYKGGGLNPQ
jgi:hypothetical protein